MGKKRTDTSADPAQTDATAADQAGDAGSTKTDPLADWQQQASYNLEQWQRTQAELDNLHKRAIKEKLEARQAGEKQVILELLPVVDNFDRALQHVPSEQAGNSWLTGVTYIHKQLLDALKECGVEPLALQVGDMFDPQTQHAVEHQPSDTIPADHILAVMTKPYTLGIELLRPGTVIVSSGQEVK